MDSIDCSDSQCFALGDCSGTGVKAATGGWLLGWLLGWLVGLVSCFLSVFIILSEEATYLQEWDGSRRFRPIVMDRWLTMDEETKRIIRIQYLPLSSIEQVKCWCESTKPKQNYCGLRPEGRLGSQCDHDWVFGVLLITHHFYPIWLATPEFGGLAA